ncbi:hypothetical protein KY284_011014 [Solanum tuberosum]|nr:hypothetical protein KY284_011014 [Solanum tuberosum]
MENRLYFRKGGKSYDLTESISASERWFESVESTRMSIRRMILSRGALLWLCKRLKEASESRGENFKT